MNAGEARGARRSDVLIVGGGPAAWALAGSCARAAMSVVLVAPSPEPTVPGAWPNTYGCWSDELDGLFDVAGSDNARRSSIIEGSWPSVRVHGTRPHDVNRTYVRIDRAVLATRLRHGDVITIADRVTGWSPGSSTGAVAVVRTAGGREIRANVVVDAAGALSGLVMRRPAVHQYAYGGLVRVERSPYEAGSCVLQDWRPHGADDDEPAPSFLYALDVGDDMWFVEETMLAAPDASHAFGPMMEILSRRLSSRLDALGVGLVVTQHEERVSIPMGHCAPAPRPDLLSFGAAAGLVHPATGYSLTTSLRTAAQVAAALSGAGTPVERTLAAWDVLWPDARRRARRLERFGLARTLGLSQSEIAEFFDTFFDLRAEDQRAYLSGRATDREMAHAMWRMFASAPWTLRRRLVGL